MTWIQTRAGVAFPLLEPKPEHVHTNDIAHALSMICRFTGHVERFYSVAEHSIRVAEILPPRLKPYGLLHDAHEAYVGDLATPIQWALNTELAHPQEDFKSALRRVKGRLDGAIHKRFGLPFPLTPIDAESIKNADTILMMTEKRDLLGVSAQPWGDEYEASVTLPGRIEPWPQAQAYTVFFAALSDIAMRGEGA